MGKQKELIVSIFKAITCLVLKYANTIWSLILSNTKIKNLQTIQNTALQMAAHKTETLLTHIYMIKSIDTQSKLHATQHKQLTQTLCLHYLITYSDSQIARSWSQQKF